MTKKVHFCPCPGVTNAKTNLCKAVARSISTNSLKTINANFSDMAAGTHPSGTPCCALIMIKALGVSYLIFLILSAQLFPQAQLWYQLVDQGKSLYL